MSLKDQLTEDMKTAMKAKDQVTLSTIRMVTSAVKNKEIELIRKLSEEETAEVIAKAIKQRRDSIEQYRKGAREDLAAKEESEIAVLERYLPKQLAEAEVTALAREAIAAVGATSAKEMGKVMGQLMPKVKGKADGGVVNRVVKGLLGG